MSAFALLTPMSGCTGVSDKNTHVSEAAAAADTVVELTLELPQIPSTVSAPEDKAGFIAIHFWDNLDFTDSRKALDTDFMEQNFVDYLSIFPAVMAEDRVEAFNTLIERSSATPETRALIEALGKKYLNHPESPMRNDEYFADFVAASGR